jgi:hypothetical protein
MRTCEVRTWGDQVMALPELSGSWAGGKHVLSSAYWDLVTAKGSVCTLNHGGQAQHTGEEGLSSALQPGPPFPAWLTVPIRSHATRLGRPGIPNFVSEHWTVTETLREATPHSQPKAEGMARFCLDSDRARFECHLAPSGATCVTYHPTSPDSCGRSENNFVLVLLWELKLLAYCQWNPGFQTALSGSQKWLRKVKGLVWGVGQVRSWSPGWRGNGFKVLTLPSASPTSPTEP